MLRNAARLAAVAPEIAATVALGAALAAARGLAFAAGALATASHATPQAKRAAALDRVVDLSNELELYDDEPATIVVNVAGRSMEFGLDEARVFLAGQADYGPIEQVIFVGKGDGDESLTPIQTASFVEQLEAQVEQAGKITAATWAT